MERRQTRHGIHHVCIRCHGSLVGLGVLRKLVDKKAVNDLWRRAYDRVGRVGRPCPVCTASMTEVSIMHDQLHIDVCTRCHMTWFDGGELDALPLVPLPPHPPEMCPEAKAVLALHNLKQIRHEAALDQDFNNNPEEAWKYLPAMLGLPVELDSRTLSRRPWLAWIFASLLVLVFLLILSDPRKVVAAWGFIPLDPFRHYGLTFWSSMLIHGGWSHLIGNTYFLLLFGTAVEDHLGIRRTLLLLLLAGFAGSLMHMAGDPRSAMPLIGASGAISGIIAYYSLLYPHARLGLLFRYFLYFRWLSFPAWGAFLMWMILQLLGVGMQLNGLGTVSSLAHLGGVLAAGLVWFVWREPR